MSLVDLVARPDGSVGLIPLHWTLARGTDLTTAPPVRPSTASVISSGIRLDLEDVSPAQGVASAPADSEKEPAASGGGASEAAYKIVSRNERTLLAQCAGRWS